ncbi:MAG: hypothetical protein ACOZNI_28595 [Myxococcota bacterium]
MTPLRALRHAATALSGAAHGGREMAPSVDLGTQALASIPTETTALAGGDAEALAQRPELGAWLTGIASWLTGAEEIDLSRPVPHGRLSLWPLLAEGDGPFDPARLGGVVPEGSVWLAARDAQRFFSQAAERLELVGTERAATWASRLRAPEGNVALVGRIVDAVGLAMDGDEQWAALRLRVTCPDAATARQTQFLLHGWRMRKALADSPAGRVFAASEIVRDGVRVEMAMPGETGVIVGLFARPARAPS